MKISLKNLSGIELHQNSHYTTFGSPIPGRQFNSGSPYKYGMNSQEKDDEIAGSGNIYTAQFWEYDSRLGRRWNVDPVFDPSLSGYACFSDNPIMLSDPNGDTPGEPNTGKTNVKSVPKTSSSSSSGLSKDNRPNQDNTAVKPSINIPKAPAASNPLDTYDNSAGPRVVGGSDQLLSANRLNTQNMTYLYDNKEPARNAGIEFPGLGVNVTIGVKNSPYSITVGTDGVSAGKEFGPLQVGTNGIELYGFAPPGADVTVNSYVYNVNNGETFVKRVDITDIYTKTSSAFVTSTNVKRIKTETYPNGQWTKAKTVDSSNYNVKFGKNFKAFSISVDAPASYKSNLKSNTSNSGAIFYFNN